MKCASAEGENMDTADRQFRRSAATEAVAGEPDMPRLFAQYGDSLLRMCCLYLGDPQLAEDAVQETFIKVYRSWEAFRGESDEKTWMVRIAINICKSQMRSSWFRRLIPKEQPWDSTGGTAFTEEDRQLEQVIQGDTVLKEINRLSPKYRQAVLLFYYQELSQKEVAEVLGISENAVATRLTRARKQLKSALKGWYFDE